MALDNEVLCVRLHSIKNRIWKMVNELDFSTEEEVIEELETIANLLLDVSDVIGKEGYEKSYKRLKGK